MNKIFILFFLFFLFFFTACKVSQKQAQQQETIVMLNIQLSTPVSYNNYSYTEIQNNIDNSIKIINSFNETLGNTTSSSARADIEKKKSKVEDIKKSWQEAGYNSSDYRQVNKDVPTEKNLSGYSDFNNFLDIGKGSLLAKSTKLFGKPDVVRKGYVAFKSGSAIILEVQSNSDDRVTRIKIFGKQGFDFAKSKGIKDTKYKFLGLNISTIEESFSSKLNYIKSSETYYTSYVKFYCPSSKNFICESIEIEW